MSFLACFGCHLLFIKGFFRCLAFHLAFLSDIVFGCFWFLVLSKVSLGYDLEFLFEFIYVSLGFHLGFLWGIAVCFFRMSFRVH